MDLDQERRLLVGGYTQSVYPLDGRWKNLEKRVWGVLAHQVLKRHHPQQLLLLGLGGGTFLQLLVHQAPRVEVVAVELDPEVVRLGQKYFGLDALPRVNFLVADALEVVRQPQLLLPRLDFDTLVVDLYLGGSYPSFMEQEDFFRSLQKLVIPGGQVFFNRILNQKDPTSRQHFLDKLAAYFVNLEVEAVPSGAQEANFIFSATKKEL